MRPGARHARDSLPGALAPQDYLKVFSETGVELTGLDVNGNPLDPDPVAGPKHAADLRRAIKVAGLLDDRFTRVTDDPLGFGSPRATYRPVLSPPARVGPGVSGGVPPNKTGTSSSSGVAVKPPALGLNRLGCPKEAGRDVEAAARVPRV